jgi:AcrR family transcriptional regulator
MPRPKLRTPALRQLVLVAGVELLAHEGTAGLTARALAVRAGTSPPALYELFGDMAGVGRALYAEGFARLAAELGSLAEAEDPVADIWALATTYRRFVRTNRALADVMFAHHLPTFSPGPDELALAAPAHQVVVQRVRRCIEAGRLRGDEADLAQVLVALVQGMAFAEADGRLGNSTEVVERRWRLAIGTLLNGWAAAAPG